MAGAYFTVYPVKPRGYNNLHVWPLYIVYIYTEKERRRNVVVVVVDGNIDVAVEFTLRVSARRDAIIDGVGENGDFIHPRSGCTRVSEFLGMI